MKLDVINKAIRENFKTLIADPLELLTEYDNDDFTQPESERWCRVTILHGDQMQIEIGNTHRQNGVMSVQIFIPRGTGDADAYEVATRINNKTTGFRAVTRDGVKFLDPTPVPVGDSGNWWQLNVNCPFYADDVG